MSDERSGAGRGLRRCRKQWPPTFDAPRSGRRVARGATLDKFQACEVLVLPGSVAGGLETLRGSATRGASSHGIGSPEGSGAVDATGDVRHSRSTRCILGGWDAPEGELELPDLNQPKAVVLLQSRLDRVLHLRLIRLLSPPRSQLEKEALSAISRSRDCRNVGNAAGALGRFI